MRVVYNSCLVSPYVAERRWASFQFLLARAAVPFTRALSSCLKFFAGAITCKCHHLQMNWILTQRYQSENTDNSFQTVRMASFPISQFPTFSPAHIHWFPAFPSSWYHQSQQWSGKCLSFNFFHEVLLVTLSYHR